MKACFTFIENSIITVSGVKLFRIVAHWHFMSFLASSECLTQDLMKFPSAFEDSFAYLVVIMINFIMYVGRCLYIKNISNIPALSNLLYGSIRG